MIYTRRIFEESRSQQYIDIEISTFIIKATKHADNFLCLRLVLAYTFAVYCCISSLD